MTLTNIESFNEPNYPSYTDRQQLTVNATEKGCLLVVTTKTEFVGMVGKPVSGYINLDKENIKKLVEELRGMLDSPEL